MVVPVSSDPGEDFLEMIFCFGLQYIPPGTTVEEYASLPIVTIQGNQKEVREFILDQIDAVFQAAQSLPNPKLKS